MGDTQSEIISQAQSIVETWTKEKFKEKLLEYTIKSLGVSSSFWVTIVTKLTVYVCEKFIFPLLDDMEMEQKYQIRKSKYHELVLKFIEGQDQDFDANFDNMMRRDV
jgi:hypothetical protein